MSRKEAPREAQHPPATGARRRAIGGSRDALAWIATRARPARFALALGLALATSACSILGEAEPIRILDPSARIAADAAWPQAKWSLLVLRPVAGATHDTDRIVVRPQPGALQVYKGAAWSDTAPDLVQTALLRGFEDTGRILSVARPGGAVRGDFQLATELRAFDSIYAGATPNATIELHARLIRTTDGRAVAAKTFRADVAADGTDVAQVSDAFGEALRQLTREVVGWSLAEGNRAD
jgi:cholesterol transport system auxiliary component